MASRCAHAEPAVPPELRRQIIRWQIVTVAWMTIEAGVALASGSAAHSPSLLGFGGDSAIEWFSAVVVLHRFVSRRPAAALERRAARVAGALLLLVALLIAVESGWALAGHRPPQPSPVGIGLLLVAAVGMPRLAARKRALARQAGSAALRADATESALCGYLSLIALAGLAANALLHLPWADAAAALALIPLVAREGWQALRHAEMCC